MSGNNIGVCGCLFILIFFFGYGRGRDGASIRAAEGG